MSDAKPPMRAQSAVVPIAVVVPGAGERRAMVTLEWQRTIEEMVKRLNDLEARVYALENP